MIDVQGAKQVRAHGVDHTAIFVLPPSFDVLERRLRGRSKDTEEQMQRRLATARAEASSYMEYDYVVVNDQLEPDRGPAAGDHRRRALADAPHARRRRRDHQDVSVLTRETSPWHSSHSA